MANDVELLKELSESILKVKKEIAKVIIGQEKVVEELLISLFAKGNCLLVGLQKHCLSVHYPSHWI